MKFTKRFGALALALALFLSALTGCGGGGSSSGGAASSSGTGGSSSGSSSGSGQIEPMDLSQVTDPVEAVCGLARDTVVANVGQAQVTADELLYWMVNGVNLNLSQSGGVELPWDLELEGGGTLSDSFKESALEVAAFYALLPQKAQAEGITEISQETQDQLAQLRDSYLGKLGSEKMVDYYFLAGGMADWNTFTALNHKADLLTQLQKAYFGEGSEGYPTDAEVLAFAQDELGAFRVKHILLMTMDQATREPLDEAAAAEKKTLAEDLLAQLRESADPIALFDQLMNQYSEDGGLATNPDGYVFDSTASLVGGFREATLALEVGQISDLVETDYGYHIMLRLPLDPADYREKAVAWRMQEKSDLWLEEAGVETTQAYDQLDLAQIWPQYQALQKAAYEQVNNVLGN